MTAEEFIAEIKAECLQSIDILQVKLDIGCCDDEEQGWCEGQLRLELDLLEKIEEWEKQKK